MSFNFHILGLFVIYLLMGIYFIRGNDKNSMFKRMLIVNFISQLLYLFSFIVLNVDSSLIVRFLVIKLFLISLIVWASMLFCYVYSKGIKYKYASLDTIYENKSRLMSSVVFIIDILLAFICLALPISIDKVMVLGNAIDYTLIVSLVILILSFVLMVIYAKRINRGDYFKLLVSIIVSFVMVIVQYMSSKLGVIASGYTFVILFIYLTMESVDAREIGILRVAYEDAKRSSESKTEFLEKLSREIRTPLNTIDGFSQVIIDEENINNIKEDVKDIRMASNNLVDLVNGIMDISLIESGKMEVSNREYDTMEMLESVSMMAKTLINKKDIEFRVEYAENIPRVLSGDSEKIKRILINLFKNAVTYTDKGEIVFKVSAVNSMDRCRLIMTVSDTGKGIAKDELNTIFNRYERTYGKSSSNGLGLAIVENLVNLMNGKVDVSSEVGKGSIFTVTVDQRIVVGDAIKTSSDDVGKIKMFDARGMRVIVVDDNKLNLKVACKLLVPYNVDVVQAVSGQEFLDIMDKDHNFDLILMDDMMPKMSGTETLEIFKKIERVDGYSIPVVVLTANAISGMRDKYLKSGFDDYLAKPIDKYELNRVMRKFLKGKVNRGEEVICEEKVELKDNIKRVKGHKIHK